MQLKALDFKDSNLPIVIITTDINPSTGKPYDIPDNPKILGSMKIIYRPDGSRNYMTDQNTTNFLNYNGRIGIELRGSSSQELPKKPYGYTTYKSDNISNNNVSILGMPKENDWILNSLAYDPSLMRDFLSYDLARSIGNYAARGQYCEVMVNGDYKGLYILMEKLKIDDDRINIIKMTNKDNSGQNVTGGYITKCDKTTGDDPVAWTLPTTNGWSVDFIHDSPKPTEITTQQNTYIKNQFVSLKNVMNASNSSTTTDYTTIIDVPTFVDFMIMNEFASNPDGYQLSTYFHKDRNGKLRAGPIWDFNLTYGNDLFIWGFDRSKTNVWQFNDGGNDGAKFWNDLFNNTFFKCYLSRRWKELTASGKPLNFVEIINKIDQIANIFSEATVREQARWNTISTHKNNISAMKTWIGIRISWLNERLYNFQACNNVSVPALVISKINYHPVASGEILSDSLEFIEITNNSNQLVNLNGIYFRELGMTYGFPANSTIAANAKIHLASSEKYFHLIYGLKPFGQFTRNLSNDSEKLVLADAFGNTIDYVEYSDRDPWPVDADGYGSLLQLIDLNSDNSLAANWKASSSISGIDNIVADYGIKVFPVPAQSTINVYSQNHHIISYEISDIFGRMVTLENNFNSTSNIINIEHLTPNIYFVKLYFENGSSIVKKIIKR